MRKIFIAAICVLFPLAGFARGTPSSETPTSGLNHILWVSAGVVGGVILVDLLVGGAVTAPVASVMNPAIQEARAAGAVFGEQIAAATEIRDAEARAAMVYTLLLGTGALLGGWLVNRFVINAPPEQSSVQ